MASDLVAFMLLEGSPADTPSSVLEEWLWHELAIWGVTVPVFEALFEYWLIHAAAEHELNQRQADMARQLALAGFIGTLDELVTIAKVLQV